MFSILRMLFLLGAVVSYCCGLSTAFARALNYSGERLQEWEQKEREKLRKDILHCFCIGLILFVIAIVCDLNTTNSLTMEVVEYIKNVK